ncbi:HNH endonuclease [Paenibacillus sp. GCM10027626]|uniref:HNH endonuclease n=1 Tax=Paenibacillus sp. GCM10027626 TaxID=3273411 RepID=UPI00363E8DFD
MRELILGKGEICLVDDDDYELLSKYSWNKSQYGYAYRLGDRSKGEIWKILMHREIMQARENQFIDHINGNRLDNRKSNLRFATRGQNAMNSAGRNGLSGYKGVFLNKTAKNPSWRALIRVNRKSIHLGCFPTKEEAALAYNAAAIKYHGEFARLNKIERHEEEEKRVFKVHLSFNHTVVRTVYAVQQLENGLTQFLLFDESFGKWMWMPASEYVPVAEKTTTPFKSKGTTPVRRA